MSDLLQCITCPKEILGATPAVLMIEPDGAPPIPMFARPELPTMPSGHRFVAVHPTCFEKVFRELSRQGQMTMMTLVVGPAGLVEESLWGDDDDDGEGDS